MSRPNTKAINEGQAKRLRAFYAKRLARGRGRGNRTLAAKKRPDGKPLGGRIRDVLFKGRVRARRFGFTLDYSRVTPVTGFHFGFAPHQVPREIVDFPAEILEENAQEFMDILNNYGRRLGAFKGRAIRVGVK